MFFAHQLENPELPDETKEAYQLVFKMLEDTLTGWKEQLEVNKWVLDDVVNLEEWSIKGCQVSELMEDLTKWYSDDKEVELLLKGDLFYYMSLPEFVSYLRERGYTITEDTITIYTVQ